MGALDRLIANQRSWMEAVAGATGGSTFEVDGVACVHQPLPHRELIVPFPRRSPTAALVDRARELGAQRVGCWTARRDLDLSELGFHPGWEPHWMAASTRAVALDPRVSEVDEVPEYDDYGQRLLALARTRESFLFVAREDGRFAGHAWLHVAAGVGGLFDVFVVDAFRRRGLGSALSLAASAKASELGVGTLTLNAEFEPLYRALGFQSLGRGQTWWRHHLCPRSLRKSDPVPTPLVVNVTPMSQATLEGHRLLASGKVREIYDAGDDRLLLVASDRISTYDVVHPTPIPDKGAVLTGLSVFWFERTQQIVPNHLVSYTDVPDEVRGRALLVEKLEMFPVECVVRGYITGSGWKDYQRSGAVCGIDLPTGLRESDQLPEPIFTPATKAEIGDHDENIDFDRAADVLGDRGALEELRRVSIDLYKFAADHARQRGIILADTKFEFGRDSESGRIVVGDEVLTPDSSRFWPADGYAPGRSQPSFDKQYVRDWASSSGWDKTPPAPALPDDVIERTSALYREAYERITGEPFAAWLERSGASA